MNPEKLEEEQRLYETKVNEFFDELKSNDSKKIKALFSENVMSFYLYHQIVKI